MENKKNSLLAFIIIIIFGLGLFIFHQTRTNMKEMGDDSNIYYYGTNDEDIKNEELFDFFVKNSSNSLNCSLLMRMNDDDIEQLLEYGILYENGYFKVYSVLNGIVQSETNFNYLVDVEYNGYIYSFLSNNKDIFEEDIQSYFDGYCFELFELNRKKIN